MVRDFYREGWALSLVVHVGLAVAVIIGLPHLRRPLPDIPDVVPVEFVSIDDVVRAPLEEAQDAPAIEEPPPEAAPQPQPQTAASVPLPDTPPPEPQAKPQAPAPRLQVTPRNKPKPPPRFDAARVAELIDRSIKSEPPPPAPAAEKTEETVPAPQRSALAARIATATLEAAIR
ncbi:MAG: hypothetical protein ACE5ED_12245 [Rhodothalassiaceae bacterium]